MTAAVWSRAAKSARDANGAVVRIGDRVTCISIHTGLPMSTGKIVRIDRCGADGTILALDVPPDPAYPHHFSHRASRAIKAP